MGPVSLSRGGARVDRTSDRVIAATSIGLAMAFLVGAGLALLLPEAVRRGAWLTIHLALAGGATTAIAGILPFFVAAFAAAPPADPRLRAGAVASVAAGALGVAAGVALSSGWLGVVSGLLFILGIVLTGLAASRPIGRGLGPARGLVTRAYLAALVSVGTGATLATILLAAWPPVAGEWVQLKPAHAWLNLVGFVSLVIATTLLHFFPTVVGSRIPNHQSGRLTVVALAVGTWLVAIGYAGNVGIVVGGGALLALVGGLALGWYEVRVWRARGRWTSDPGWHRFAIGGLVSATGWFVVGLILASLPTLSAGASPSGWAADRVVGPLIGGWAGMALLASATHLVPAIGPGDPPAHAGQRAILGWGATARLVAIDLGVGLITVGQVAGQATLTSVGLVTLAAGYAASAVLLAFAVARGLGWVRTMRRRPAA